MPTEDQKITVRARGPYIVEGSVPLVYKKPITSEHGEPLTWQKGRAIPTAHTYTLCRCGASGTMPFCNGAHASVDFDAGEAADSEPIAAREKTYEGNGLAIKDDRSLCMQAGFCSNRVTNVWKMVKESGDTQVRTQIMAMIERCPSGALSYTVEPDGDVIEPDLPSEIAVTPDGALWVSGNIPIQVPGGQFLETRNRVTLCRCGDSKNKPFCDGTHKEKGFTDQ